MIKFSGYKFIPRLFDYGIKNGKYWEKWIISVSLWERAYNKRIHLPIFKRGMDKYVALNEFQIKEEL